MATACSHRTHSLLPSPDQGGGGGCFAPLSGCAPPASAMGNATAFRASLAPLPSAAAAAAEGFAALRSQPDPGRDRAHALGLCFGFGFGGVADASDCHACLRAAVAAASEGCANDTRRAGVWSHGCLLAYYAGDVASSYTDALEQTLADLTMALAQPKGPSLWRKAQSIMSFVLAVIGAVTVVVLACFLVGCYLLAETLFGNMAEQVRRAMGSLCILLQQMAKHRSGRWRRSSDSTSWAVREIRSPRAACRLRVGL